MLLRYAISVDGKYPKPLAYCSSTEKAIELVSTPTKRGTQLLAWVGSEEDGKWFLEAVYRKSSYSPRPDWILLKGVETALDRPVTARAFMHLVNKIRVLEERVEELEALEGPTEK